MKKIIAILAAIMSVAACTVTTSGTPISFGEPTDPIWCVGDSISVPTCARLDGVYTLGVGGSGFYQAPTVFDQLQDALDSSGLVPETVLVITGGNDYAVGRSIDEILSRANAFTDYERTQGLDVRFITEPIPEGTDLWNGYKAYNDWLVSYYDDTIDCAWAGYPTNTSGAYPVHPTVEGYDNYANCIRNLI